MRHLAFYYAVGFAIVGCIMLGAYLSTFISIMFNNHNSYVTVALATALSLPFMISTLSWRDWRKTQKNKDTEGGPEKDDTQPLER